MLFYNILYADLRVSVTRLMTNNATPL